MATRIVWHPRRFNEKTNKEITNKLVMSGEIVEGLAKENCPVDTEKLKNSIKTTEPEKEGSSSESIQNQNIKVGTNVSYAPFVEFGTRNQPPRAFLRRAINQAAQQIKRIFSTD